MTTVAQLIPDTFTNARKAALLAALAEVAEWGPHRLTTETDAAWTPDPDTPGAAYVATVRDAIVEAIATEWAPDNTDRTPDADQMADELLIWERVDPSSTELVYTHKMARAFFDLGAHEAADAMRAEMGTWHDEDGMTGLMNAALARIGEQVAREVLYVVAASLRDAEWEHLDDDEDE